MRIDISRDEFTRANNYSRVLLQQGRPLLDSDWNEQGAIVLAQLRAATRAIYGEHGGPAGLRCGFVPYWAHGALWLSRGLYSIDGYTVACPGRAVIAGANQSKEGSQLPVLPEAGDYVLYLEFVEGTATSTTSATLSEPALPGVDLAARGRLQWRVGLKRITTKETEIDIIRGWLAAYEGDVDGAVAEASPEISKTLKELAASCRNQLVRLELHDKSDPKQAIWKFSRNNAFALFRVVKPTEVERAKADPPSLTSVVIEPGNLADWKPKPRDVVELLTEDQVAFNGQGELRDVLAVTEVPPQEETQDDLDEQRYRVEFAEPVQHWVQYVRVWDQRVPELRDAGDAAPGDYWQMTARDAPEGSQALRFFQVRRLRAPLAVLSIGSPLVPPKIIRRLQRVVNVPWREVDEEYECIPRPEK